jgi:hypothetical protein
MEEPHIHLVHTLGQPIPPDTVPQIAANGIGGDGISVGNVMGIRPGASVSDFKGFSSDDIVHGAKHVDDPDWETRFNRKDHHGVRDTSYANGDARHSGYHSHVVVPWSTDPINGACEMGGGRGKRYIPVYRNDRMTVRDENMGANRNIRRLKGQWNGHGSRKRWRPNLSGKKRRRYCVGAVLDGIVWNLRLSYSLSIKQYQGCHMCTNCILGWIAVVIACVGHENGHGWRRTHFPAKS